MGSFIKNVWNNFMCFIEENLYYRNNINDELEAKNMEHIKMLD
jgi:hypothetical protein